MAGNNVRRSFLLVALLAVAAMATAKVPATSTEQTSSSTTTTPASTGEQTSTATTTTTTTPGAAASLSDIPPFPAPADVPPCLDEMATCAQVYQDKSNLGPCCDGVKKVMASDPACLCNMISDAVKSMKQSGAPIDGTEIFRACGMSPDSCAAKGAAKGAPGSQNAGSSRSIGGASQVMLLVPLLFAVAL